MTTFAAVAQPAEHLTSIQDVAGSTPACGSIFHQFTTTMQPHQTSTKTLVSALRILAQDIQSDDGVANAAIAEAADRLEFQDTQIRNLLALLEEHQG